MKRFIILTNGQIIDTKNVDSDLMTENVNKTGMFRLVIKGEKLFKVYKIENSFLDERIELGFIDTDTDDIDEAHSHALDCRITHLFSILEEDRWKDCNHYNDCSVCWRFDEDEGLCSDELVEAAENAYLKNTISDTDKKTIQNIVMKENFSRQELRSFLRKIGKKY